ncbi:clasp N terminal-domain-containing protein [Phakopsora pachyrhizi]|uniref:Clasp N terminal-domain-containing protein n=1 Tax=Phakopsora pachyrhizi TaxID=170000 RepID=A0AAV0B9U4_PHAPC|nr:clasp N terminal-domain-containing protein [Phakopsora pachyrhizi]
MTPVNQSSSHQASIDSALSNGSDNEKRVKCLNSIRSGIESSDSDSFQISDILPSLISLLKLAIESSNAHLSFAGLSCLPVVLNRLSRLVSDSEAGSLPVVPLRSIINSLYSNSSGSVVSFLGDSKLRTRELARSALCAIASLAFEYHRKVNQLNFSSNNSNLQKSDETLAEIERIVKDQALANKVARARAQAIYFLSETRARYPGLLSIRSYLPILVSLLEDSDASVRSAASESIIKIFSDKNLPGSARADLKNELTKQGIRKTTVDLILNSVFNPQNQQPALLSLGEDELPECCPDDPPGSRPSPSIPLKTLPLSNGQPVIQSEPNPTPPNSGIIQPIFVSSPKELENIFAKMLPPWQGKETEHNWQAREANISTLRGMIKTNVHFEHTQDFILGLRSIADGLFKSLFSLRTTMAIGVCSVILELTSLGTALDPLVEIFLPALLQLASQTKKIVFQASQASALAIIRTTSYHSRTLQLLLSCTSEKTVQARGAGMTLIKEFLDSHAQRSRNQIESGGAWACLEKALRKSLGDPSPIVRQTARETYCSCSEIWPKLSEALVESLDPTTRKQLEKASAGGGSRLLSKSTSERPTSQRVSVRTLIKSSRETQRANLENSEPKPAIFTSPQRRSVSNQQQPSARRFNEKARSSAPLSSPKLSSSTSSLTSGQTFAPSDQSKLPQARHSGEIRRTPFEAIPSRPRSSSSNSLISPSRKSISGGRTPLSVRSTLTPPRAWNSTERNQMTPSKQDREIALLSPRGSTANNQSPMARSGLSEGPLTDIGTPSTHGKQRNGSKTNDEYMIEDALKAQAEQAESAAHRLLELSEDDSDPFASLIERFPTKDEVFPLVEKDVLKQVVPPTLDRASKVMKDYAIEFENSPRSGLKNVRGVNKFKNEDSHSRAMINQELSKECDGNIRDMNNFKAINDAKESWWHRQAEYSLSLNSNNQEVLSSSNTSAEEERELNLKLSRIFYIKRSSKPKDSGKLKQQEAEEQKLIEKNSKFWDGFESNVSGVKIDEVFDVLKDRLRINNEQEISKDKLEEESIVKDSQMILLRSMIIYQNNYMQGREVEIFETLLRLTIIIDRFDRFKKSNIIAGVEALGSLWTEFTEPIYGLSCLRICIENLEKLNPEKGKRTFKKLNPDKNSDQKQRQQQQQNQMRTEDEDDQGYWLGLSMDCLKDFMTKLPVEIIEEELLKSKTLIKRALNHSRSEIRMKGVSLLRGCNLIFKDVNEIIKILRTKSQASSKSIRKRVDRDLNGLYTGDDNDVDEVEEEEGLESGDHDGERGEDEWELNEAQEALLTYYLN